MGRPSSDMERDACHDDFGKRRERMAQPRRGVLIKGALPPANSELGNDDRQCQLGALSVQRLNVRDRRCNDCAIGRLDYLERDVIAQRSQSFWKRFASSSVGVTCSASTGWRSDVANASARMVGRFR